MTIGLSGTGNPHQVDLSWVAPSNSSVPIAGYHVYRAAGTGGFATIGSVSTQTAYTDTGVQSGSTYQYYVTSVDSSGVESTPSNTTTVTIP
jgi:fibronectin type 3 domain-containing protein